MGDNDRALEFLDKALKGKSLSMPSIPAEPKWDELRQDMRFKAVIHAIGFRA
jgi:hypothetical protein